MPKAGGSAAGGGRMVRENPWVFNWQEKEKKRPSRKMKVRRGSDETLLYQPKVRAWFLAEFVKQQKSNKGKQEKK